MLFHTVLFVLRSVLILLFKKEERENTQQEKKVHIDIDDDDNDNQIINHINILHQQQGNEACFFTSGDDEWLRGRLNSNRGSLQVPAS